MELKGRKKAYDRLAELTWKKKWTIKVYFFRNKLDVLNIEHQKMYLKKFLKDESWKFENTGTTRQI